MAKPQTKRLTPAEQHKRFVAMAAEVGADDKPGALDRAFDKIKPKRKPAKSK